MERLESVDADIVLERLRAAIHHRNRRRGVRDQQRGRHSLGKFAGRRFGRGRRLHGRQQRGPGAQEHGVAAERGGSALFTVQAQDAFVQPSPWI